MCRDMCVPTNLAIDDRLLNEALQIGNKGTKKETVNEALREFIRRRKQQGILKLFGRVGWDKDYDYKKGRSR